MTGACKRLRTCHMIAPFAGFGPRLITIQRPGLPFDTLYAADNISNDYVEVKEEEEEEEERKAKLAHLTLPHAGGDSKQGANTSQEHSQRSACCLPVQLLITS